MNERLIQNTGAVRDLCQDICLELDNLRENENLDNQDKEALGALYNSAKESVDDLTKLGYFNKTSKSGDKSAVTKLVEKVLSCEEKGNTIAQKIWPKEITSIDDFNQNQFTLCVKRLPGDIKKVEEYLNEAFTLKPAFYSANLISNQNINVKTNLINENPLSMPYGIVYEVGPQSFCMASDTASICSQKQKDFETDSQTREVVFGDLKACVSGTAVKLKTPHSIVSKNLANPLVKNENVVVLDPNYTKPVAVFCCSYNIKKIHLLKRKLSFVAKRMKIPMITINVLKFYQNNKNYFVNNTQARKIFNNLVDSICLDLNNYCKYDFMTGAKRLIGLNKNLRYNFIYKFATSINSFLDGKDGMDEGDTADYIVELFLKAVEKHNHLTKKREKANGAPLFFPDDTVFIPLPKSFLKEE